MGLLSFSRFAATPGRVSHPSSPLFHSPFSCFPLMPPPLVREGPLPSPSVSCAQGQATGRAGAREREGDLGGGTGALVDGVSGRMLPLCCTRGITRAALIGPQLAGRPNGIGGAARQARADCGQAVPRPPMCAACFAPMPASARRACRPYRQAVSDGRCSARFALENPHPCYLDFQRSYEQTDDGVGIRARVYVLTAFFTFPSYREGGELEKLVNGAALQILAA